MFFTLPSVYDRKVSTEQRRVDEKEEEIRVTLERCRVRDVEVEKRMAELKQRETEVTSESSYYKNTLSMLEARDVKSLEQVHLSLHIMSPAMTRTS